MPEQNPPNVGNIPAPWSKDDHYVIDDMGHFIHISIFPHVDFHRFPIGFPWFSYGFSSGSPRQSQSSAHAQVAAEIAKAPYAKAGEKVDEGPPKPSLMGCNKHGLQ